MICAYGDDIHAGAWWYAKPAAWIKKEVTFGRQKLLLFWRAGRDSMGSAHRLLRKPRLCSASPSGGSSPTKSFKHKIKNSTTDAVLFLMARRKGLEPLTFWFVARHSIQLSYRRIYGADDEARTRYLHLGKVALYQMSYIRKCKKNYTHNRLKCQ